MSSSSAAPAVSKPALWGGRILSALPVLGLLASGIMKLTQSGMVVKEFARLGYTPGVILPLGIVEVACVVLYVIPQTSYLGAILLTGYLGGATATHVRLEENWIPPIIFGILVWTGLYLRDPRLRALALWRKLD